MHLRLRNWYEQAGGSLPLASAGKYRRTFTVFRYPLGMQLRIIDYETNPHVTLILK
jgi:hypothetical protein